VESTLHQTFDKYRLGEIILAPIVSLNNVRYRVSLHPIPRCQLLLELYWLSVRDMARYVIPVCG
jgi:hypothetical protein